MFSNFNDFTFVHDNNFVDVHDCVSGKKTSVFCVKKHLYEKEKANNL